MPRDRDDALRPGRIRLDFGAQPVDVGIDGVFVAFVAKSPHAVQQLGPAEHSAGMAHEMTQQIELPGRQLDRAASESDLPSRGVDLEIAVNNSSRFGYYGGRQLVQVFDTAKYRAYTSNEFENAERFGQVVIRSCFQAQHAIEFCGLGRQHQYWLVLPFAPDFATNLQAIGTREAQIEDDQCPLLGDSQPHPLIAVCCYDKLVTQIHEMQRDELGDVLFVFDQENTALAHVKIPFGRRVIVLPLRRTLIIDRESHGIITGKAGTALPCAALGQESIGSRDSDVRDGIIESVLLRQNRRSESVITADDARMHRNMIRAVVPRDIESFTTGGRTRDVGCKFRIGFRTCIVGDAMTRQRITDCHVGHRCCRNARKGVVRIDQHGADAQLQARQLGLE
jgi:hypothetical protein